METEGQRKQEDTMKDITMSDMNEAVFYGKVHGSCQLSAGCDFWYSWGTYDDDYKISCGKTQGFNLGMIARHRLTL